MMHLLFMIILACTTNLVFAIEQNDLNLLTPKLLELARKELKYSKPVDSPKIVIRTEKQLTKIFCPRTKCYVSGIYDKGVIYIANTLDIEDEISISILYHEFVHHVQAQIHGPTYDCKLWHKKEKQAYFLQKKYLESRGFKTDFISQIIAELRCPDE